MQAEEIRVGDVFPDLRATVAYPPEPVSDLLCAVECYLEGTNGAQTVTLVLPKEHKVNVHRL